MDALVLIKKQDAKLIDTLFKLAIYHVLNKYPALDKEIKTVLRKKDKSQIVKIATILGVLNASPEFESVLKRKNYQIDALKKTKLSDLCIDVTTKVISVDEFVNKSMSI
jgi:hypothetical protein